MNTTMDHTLVNTNQLQHFGVTVQENPYSSSTLYIESPDRDLVLPLIVEGTNILAHTRTPTSKELATCRHIVMSSQHEWNPHSVKFPKALRSVEEEIDYRRSIASMIRPVAAVLYYDDDKDDNIQGYQRCLIASVKVTYAVKVKISTIALDDVPTPCTFVSKEQNLAVTATEISERWLIGLAQATTTLKSTTKKIVRSDFLPLGIRFKADRLYHLPCLPGDWYNDTLHGRTKSKTGNKYGQVFANNAYFAVIYPMDTKKKVGKALRVFC